MGNKIYQTLLQQHFFFTFEHLLKCFKLTISKLFDIVLFGFVIELDGYCVKKI